MSQGMGECYWHPVDRGQVLLNTYNAQHSPPPTKDYLAPNVISDKVEKPRFRCIDKPVIPVLGGLGYRVVLGVTSVIIYPSALVRSLLVPHKQHHL